MSNLVLIKDGEKIDINDHPSLLASLHANNRAINRINEEIRIRQDEVEELTERLELHQELGLETQGIKALRTRRKNHIAQLKKRKAAHQKNYLEVPDMGGRKLAMNEEGWSWRTVNLSTKAPLDVLRALKHAKEQEIFDEFRVYEPSETDTDPMIVGVVGDATFYIASWR